MSKLPVLFYFLQFRYNNKGEKYNCVRIAIARGTHLSTFFIFLFNVAFDFPIVSMIIIFHKNAAIMRIYHDMYGNEKIKK